MSDQPQRIVLDMAGAEEFVAESIGWAECSAANLIRVDETPPQTPAQEDKS